MVTDMQIGMIKEVNMAAATNSFDWWFDFGATVHVCNEKAQFKTYVIATDGEEVLMGKGTVEMLFTYGKKLILTNVFHVPEIKKNLVSVNLLCKKGMKAVIKSDKLILSKNGMFIGKGYFCDEMFKLSTINKAISHSSYIVESSLWHDHLAHLNFKYLKYMSKRGLISYKHDHNETCEICIQAKMTKKPFPTIHRNSQILQIIHSDICELNGILTRGGKRYFIE
jgi:hypothetical protein